MPLPIGDPSPVLANAPDLIPPLGHYSHLSSIHGLTYISGQLPLDRHGVILADQPFGVQVTQTLANLERCLAAVGFNPAQLVQVRVYVTEIRNWKTFDDIYSEWIGAHRPARAVAGVTELHHGAAVEIEAVAAGAPRG